MTGKGKGLLRQKVYWWLSSDRGDGRLGEGCKIPFWDNKNILKLIMLWIHNSVNKLKATELYTLHGSLICEKISL